MIMDEIAETYREGAVGGGKVSEKVQNTYLSDQIKSYTARYGEGGKAFAQLRLDYEKDGAFDKGRVFEGLDANKAGFSKNATFLQYLDETGTKLGNEYGGELNKNSLVLMALESQLTQQNLQNDLKQCLRSSKPHFKKRQVRGLLCLLVLLE